jgi:TonB-linked outer membrane protein, SusC/RagA family
MNWIVPGKGMRNLSLIKCLLIMKLIIACILVASLHVSAESFGQRVTMDVKNIPIAQVFRMLSVQTGHEFLLSPAVTEYTAPVTLQVKDMRVDALLEKLTTERGLRYEIRNNVIIITRSETPATTTSAVKPPDPQILLRGRVTDITGMPLPGATVMIKGTKRGTQTDINGYFELKTDQAENALVITYTGFGVVTVKAIPDRVMTIPLSPSTNDLDQVQVIGYGRTSKRFNTGDVATVRAEEIQRNPVSNVLSALQGRVPGLIITQNSGMPGSSFNINIRGRNSLNGNEPLIIIDGVPYPSNRLSLLNQTLRGGSYLDYFNPADIERIDVLKDADATSIYGSRGANGVILVTTKKGKPGKTRVDVNMYSGFSSAATAPKLLNLQQYLEMRHEAKRNDGLPILPTDYDINGTWDSTRSTDWQKYFLKKKAYVNDAQVSISGGAGNTTFLIGGGYHRQTSVMLGDGADRRASMHFSTTTETNNKKVMVQLSGNYSYNFNNIRAVDLSSTSLLLPPNAPPVHNPDGSLNYYEFGTNRNPLTELEKRYKKTGHNLVANAFISYRPLKGLELKTTLGYNNSDINEFLGTPLTYYYPNQLSNPNNVSESDFSEFNTDTWTIEPQAVYTIAIGKGVLDALAGATFNSTKSNSQNISAVGFSDDALLENPAAANTTSISGFSQSVYHYNAAFGRIKYTHNNRYLLSLTGRYDGSSRFGPGRQFHFFGSAGVGWIFTEEAFIKNNVSFLSFGKLRGSYGTTGNDQIGDYNFYDLYSSAGAYQNTQGLSASRLYNPDLHWELNKKLEGGIELGFLKDRIFLEANYYVNRGSDQLLSYTLSNVTGFSGINRNSPATIQNKGLEITLRTTNIRTKNFTWSTNFNISANRNKLVEYPNLSGSSDESKYLLNRPVDIVRVYNFAGVDPQTGQYTFYDSKGSIVTTPNATTDRTAIIELTPKYFGGLNNSFQYKGFSLDVLFSFMNRTGYSAFAQQQMFPPGFMLNMTTDVLARWRQPGDITDIRSYTTSLLGFFAQGNVLSSTRAYANARYARLQNLSLAYQLPQATLLKWRISGLRVYLQGQNLLTISSYRNTDPENLNSSSLPPLRQYTGGFQITL